MDTSTDDDYDGDELCPTAAYVKKVINGVVHIGVAFTIPRRRKDEKDKKRFTLQVQEFVDCEQLSNLESVLLRVNPSKCHHSIFSKTQAAEERRLDQVLESLEIESESHERSSFKADNVEQDLRMLLGEDSLSRYKSELTLQLSMQALSCLIKHEILSIEETEGACILEMGRMDKYVRLDHAAMDALNLLPTKDDINKESSVFGVLNRCVTNGVGSKLLKRWIRQPLITLKDIKMRQDTVKALHEDSTRLDNIRACLKNVPDLDRLVRKLQTDKATLPEMYRLYLFATSLPKMASTIDSVESGNQEANDLLNELSKSVRALSSKDRFQKYIELVENVLDLDKAPREFRVKPCHDTTGELDALATKLASLESRVEELREDIEDSELSGMNAKFETDPKMLNTYGYHFRVHKRNDNALKRLKGKRYKYLAVVSSGIRWTTTELSGLHDEYLDYTAQFDKAQSKLVKDAVGVAKTFLPLVELAADTVARLDVLCSFAYVATYAPNGYTCPELYPLGKGTFSIKAARHPCLELQQDVDFIPNDFELEKGKSSLQIVTGPNMGGKSTYIRQLGIISVMAQIGSFVPCDEASLPVVDAILARIGASDAQNKGVSTFMSEMIEASAILKTATANSLVIIDELGRGTSTYDGFGLAWSISNHLATKIKAFCLFATHYHELTALESECPAVVNKHVTAVVNDQAITMLYEVNDGACGESFGINIAKLAGFPAAVIETAKRKAVELEGVTPNAEKKRHKSSCSISGFVKAFAAMNESEIGSLETLQQKLQPLLFA